MCVKSPILSREAVSLLVCAALAAGEAAGFALGGPGTCWPTCAVAAAFAALFGYAFRWRRWPFAAVFLLGAALALRSAGEREREVIRMETESGRDPARAELVAKEDARVRVRKDGSSWAVFPGMAGELPLRVVVPLADGDTAPRRGERWICMGWLSRPPKKGGARTLWVRGRGTFARRGEQTVACRLQSAAESLRESLLRRAGFGIGEEARARAAAMLLGERTALDPAVKADFVAAGTIHVFAISGLHVMVVARVLMALALLAAVPLRLASLAVVPLVWAYVFAVGLPPSAVRAAAMATAYLAAPLFWRRPDAVAAWSAAFLVVHVVSPESIVNVGSQLSFAVMLALVAWARWTCPDHAEDGDGLRPGSALAARLGAACRARTLAGALSGLGTALAGTLVAWAAGVPIAAHAFGRVTPGGVVANLAAVPIACAGVVAGALGCLLGFVSPKVAAHCNNAAALATQAMSGVSRAVSATGVSSFDVAPWPWWMCATWYAALAMCLWLFRRRRRGLL